MDIYSSSSSSSSSWSSPSMYQRVGTALYMCLQEPDGCTAMGMTHSVRMGRNWIDVHVDRSHSVPLGRNPMGVPKGTTHLSISRYKPTQYLWVGTRWVYQWVRPISQSLVQTHSVPLGRNPIGVPMGKNPLSVCR